MKPICLKNNIPLALFSLIKLKMEKWQEEMLDMLFTIEEFSEHEVFQRIKKTAYSLGFEYVAYGLRLPLPVTNPKVIMMNSYPSHWQERYIQQGYLAIDPIVLHGLKSCDPVVWRDEIFKFARHFWAEAQAEGLNFGWSQSSVDSHGLIGMLSLARSSEAITDDELINKEARMRWLANMTHLALSRVLLRNFRNQHAPDLTSRELEVLKWTADGKSAEDIADILRISPNTVNFHIKNLTFKLNTSNKTAAVLRAAMLGLLHKP